MKAIEIVGVVLGGLGAGCTFTALAGVAAGITLQGWYFPGDPPYADLAIVPAALGIAISSIIRLVTRRQRTGATIFLRLNRLVLGTASLAVALCTLCIAFRFTPVWADVRHGIRTYGDEIANVVGDRNQVLTEAEFVTLKRQFIPAPVPVELRGYGTVYLRMAHGIYPYVGVDFSDASHALFDPVTMLCMYSD